MRRTGVADTPLHGGKAPRWLFRRMQALAREIVSAIVEEFGPGELLQRLSDPFWFQALGSVLGFDWHSSGVTTTVCGALKEGIRGLEKELGFFAAGGKGKASLKTPAEITAFGQDLSVDPSGLVYASRMSAKVDNAAVQDGFTLYHHVIFFTADGRWTVVQQGMNETSRYARRYHWLGEGLASFTCEPHSGIWAARRENKVLNLVAQESEQTRLASAALSCQAPERLLRELERTLHLRMPARHEILDADIDPKRLQKTLLASYEAQPGSFDELLGVRGVGPRTLRALAFLAEIIYGAHPSFRDPARFGYAHGGKDGHPYPVDRETYDKSIEVLRQAVERAKLGDRDRLYALRKLERMHGS
jgi:hypothetical protein